MNTNRKQTLVSRLIRNGVHADIANALAQSGLLTYEQSRSVTGREAIRRQAMDAYEAAENKATVNRVWNGDRMEFDYEVKTDGRTDGDVHHAERGARMRLALRRGRVPAGRVRNGAPHARARGEA